MAKHEIYNIQVLAHDSIDYQTVYAVVTDELRQWSLQYGARKALGRVEIGLDPDDCETLLIRAMERAPVKRVPRNNYQTNKECPT